MARITVFGAGVMGTALAIHLARKGEEVTVWGSEFDARVLPSLENERTHPALPGRLPDGVRVLGPDALARAAEGAGVAVLAANSGGARSLARMVAPVLGGGTVVSIAKGLEPESRTRVSEVYREELPARPVVAIGGPSLAAEVAEELPTAAVFACHDADALAGVAEAFRTGRYLVDETDDVAGVEYCGVAKNVAAIGAGILEGMGHLREQEFKNARAALFARAVHEMAALVESLGGRRETALGLAGMGDLLVTSIGGRNRAYGEAIGSGADPQHTLEDMTARGLTVEGAESARDVHVLAKEAGLELPVHEAVYRIVHEGAPRESVVEVLG